MTPDTPHKRSRPKRRYPLWRHLVRWAIYSAFVALALGVSAFLLLTRSFVTRHLVTSRLGAMLGAEVTASSAVVGLDARVTVRDLRLRAPGIPGEAGVVLQVKRLDFRPSWRGLLSGETRIYGVELEEPIARFSQSVDDGSLNLAALKVPEFRPEAKLPDPPQVLVTRGVIELGEHRAGATPTFTALRRLNIGGEVMRSPGEKGEWVVVVRQLGGGPREAGLLDVRGTLGRDGMSLTVGGLPLDAWPVESVPTPLREAFRRLDLQGRIGTTEFRYDAGGAVRARIELVDVALNLPVETQPEVDIDGNVVPLPPEQVGRQLRMTRVNGTVTLSGDLIIGELTGLVEELPYHVLLTIYGTTPEAPFRLDLRAESFELKTRPQIVRFASGLVQRRMVQFGNPTGLVDAHVTVLRGEAVDGVAPPVAVSGELVFRNATASFERFPYAFERMTGRWRFDEDSIEILNMEGVAPSGARVLATGFISPLTGEAEAKIDVAITGLPIDEALARALGPRSRIIDALFSRPHYLALAEAGLVLTPERRADLASLLEWLEAGSSGPEPLREANIESVRAYLRTPVFEMGGRVDVGVKVRRDFGVDGEWWDEITIDLADVGLLPEAFPYPLRTRHVRVLKDNVVAMIDLGKVAGLTGGTGEITAVLDLTKVDVPDEPFVPDVEVEARDLPVDGRLAFALPSGRDRGELSAREILEAFRARGVLTRVEARIGIGLDDQLGYVINSTLRDGVLAPAPLGDPPDAPAREVVDQLEGAINVSTGAVSIDLRGRAGETPVAMQGVLGSGAGESSRTVRATVATPGLDASRHVEDFAAVFGAGGAEAIARLRAEHSPRGSADAILRVTREAPGEDLRVGVEVENPELAFTLGNDAIEVTHATGEVRVDAPVGQAPPRLEFASFRASVSCAGDHAGAVAADGSIGLGDGPSAPSDRLAIALEGGRLESGLIGHVVGLAGGEASASYRSLAPAGLFDADAVIASDRTGTKRAVSGRIRPRQVALDLSGGRVSVARVAGEIEFSPGAGLLKGLRLEGEGWSAGAEGSWTVGEDGTIRLEAGVEASADSLREELRAAMPRDLVAVLDDLKVDAAGPITLRDASFSLSMPSPRSTPMEDAAAGRTVKLAGILDVRRARVDVGVAIEGIDGTMDARYERRPGEASPTFDLRAVASRLSAFNVPMTDGRVRILGEPDGSIHVPLFMAACLGGRVATTALVEARDATGERPYHADCRLSDVRFAPLLAHLGVASASPGVLGADEPAPAPAQGAPDESRGRVDAQVSLTGLSGDVSSRRGRGTATIGGARVANLPLVVPLVRISNLQLPISERLDYAKSSFYLRGGRVTFEELSLSSASVAIQGSGTLDLPETNLDLAFRSRSRVGLPILSRVIDSLRNELVSAEVTGTLAEPRVRLVGLVGKTSIMESGAGSTRPGAAPDAGSR